MSNEKMKLTVIKTKNEFFVSENPPYGKSVLIDFLINGESPKKTFKENWVSISKEPKKIEKFIYQPNINYRYELIDKSLESEKFPVVFKKEDVTLKKGYDSYWKPEFSHLQSLYKEFSDPQPKTLEEVEFEIKETLYFDEVKKFNGFVYPVQRTQWSHEGFVNLTEQNVSYDLIDQLVSPDITLPMRPAHLTSTQSYKIIRKFVRDNIDPKVAVISSDYDFCFTVKKKIACEPISYTVDLNAWKSRAKPKLETRFRHYRDVVVFEMGHSEHPYKGYTAIDGFKGENVEQLKFNIDTYLEEIIKEINKPLVDCQKCKGLGVLTEEIK